MIILDAEEKEPSKQLRDPFSGGLTLRFPEKALSRSDSPLPDYETSEAHQKLIAKELSAKPKGIEPRLWRAISFALGLYVLLTIVIGVPIIVVKRHQSDNGPVDYGGDNDYNELQMIPNPDPNICSSVTECTKCDWDRFEFFNPSSFHAYAEYNLTYAGSFCIRSNISNASSSNTSHSKGNLTVDLNPDPSVSEVRLTVDAEATSDDLLRHCFIDSGSNRGLLIYVTRPPLEDSVNVNIKMLLPRNTSSTILDHFVTDLPWFSHTFGDLRNHTVKNISLSGAHLNVTAGLLKGNNISVKNAYASIVGDFHATSSLSLDGIKGDIHANITLERLYSSKSSTSLFLDAGDGSIDANVTLVAPSKVSPFSPTFPFTADVQTFNGPVTFHADYTNSTPPTPLKLSVTNTDGKTDVSLGKKFEGNFSVQSKLGDVQVPKPYISPSLDPLGKRRQYNFQTQQESTNLVSGWVGWGKLEDADDDSQGQVRVSTSLSPITLRLAIP